jgi:hypothetical protein
MEERPGAMTRTRSKYLDNMLRGYFRMKFRTRFKGIDMFFLLTLVFLFWGCGSIRRTISVPMNPSGELRAYRKIPVSAGLFISKENKYYAFKGTPSGHQFSGLEHSFPLGKALETISLQVFSQYYREVKLMTGRAEGRNFKIIIVPQIEGFDFRYDYVTKGSGSSTSEYVVPTVAMNVQVAFYGDGHEIWKKSRKSSARKEVYMVSSNFRYEKAMGEVASRALSESVSVLAEELMMAPEVEKYLADVVAEEWKRSSYL